MTRFPLASARSRTRWIHAIVASEIRPLVSAWSSDSLSRYLHESIPMTHSPGAGSTT